MKFNQSSYNYITLHFIVVCKLNKPRILLKIKNKKKKEAEKKRFLHTASSHSFPFVLTKIGRLKHWHFKQLLHYASTGIILYIPKHLPETPTRLASVSHFFYDFLARQCKMTTLSLRGDTGSVDIVLKSILCSSPPLQQH